MSIRSIETLYEQVRAVAPAPSGADVTPVVTTVVPGIRVLALRTPTLLPAAHTNVYLVGPDAGPVAVVDPGVGTSREIVAVSAEDHVFLAPDNGLLAPVVARHPDAGGPR